MQIICLVGARSELKQLLCYFAFREKQQQRLTLVVNLISMDYDHMVK